MKKSIACRLVAALLFAPALTAQTPVVPRSGTLAFESLLEISHTSSSAIAEGTRPLGEIRTFQSRAGIIHTLPVEQAVVTGAYRAVVYIKENMKLDASTASIEASKEVVKICTQYAQKGMINIFIVIFCFSLSLAFFDPFFFIGYLIGMAFFGLFQAIFMANAGGAWDNAKKIVEVELKMKNTPLHAATVVGDTVGDPFKDTSSVSLNPVIKFTTLFGLLAVEIAVKMPDNIKHLLGGVIFVVGLVFVYRSFYSMRIPTNPRDADVAPHQMQNG